MKVAKVPFLPLATVVVLLEGIVVMLEKVVVLLEGVVALLGAVAVLQLVAAAVVVFDVIAVALQLPIIVLATLGLVSTDSRLSGPLAVAVVLPVSVQ